MLKGLHKVEMRIGELFAASSSRFEIYCSREAGMFPTVPQCACLMLVNASAHTKSDHLAVIQLPFVSLTLRTTTSSARSF